MSVAVLVAVVVLLVPAAALGTARRLQSPSLDPEAPTECTPWKWEGFDKGNSFLNPEIAEAYPFPFESQGQTKCRLLVICAGAPRSGSTLQTGVAVHALNVLVELANKLKKGRNHAVAGGREDAALVVHDMGYWMHHVHSKSPEEGEAYRKNMAERIARYGRESILVVKSHDYDEQLFRLCDDYIALTTYRDPLNVMSSYLRRGWITAHSTEVMCYTVKRILSRHAAWARHVTVNTKYEESATNLFSSFAEVFFALAPVVVPDAESGDLVRALHSAWSDESFQDKFILRTGPNVKKDMLSTHDDGGEQYAFDQRVLKKLLAVTGKWRKTMAYPDVEVG